MEITKPSIGIMGLGVVGTALKTFLEYKEYSVFTYDKSTDSNISLPLLSTDFIFICVPTPTTNIVEGQDLSATEFCLSQLQRLKYRGLVVIKSTILPGTTKILSEIYFKLNIVCSPEFLTESTALEDTSHPDKLLIGYTRGSEAFKLRGLYQSLYPHLPIFSGPSEQIEMTKYMINTYYALRVTYANQMYDLCTKLGINYSGVRLLFEQDKRVEPGHFEIFYKGKSVRGYGGKCLPKDVKALLVLARENRLDLPLLETMDKLNWGYINDSGS